MFIQLLDSLAGTITRTYDDRDRLTSETTPQGTVSYTYDAANRRTSMTVAGQLPITYTYDAAHRLTQLTQGLLSTAYTYDDANRRTTATLPNGIVITYDYDAASHLTGLTYTHGMTTLGTLTYAYDAGGNRTVVGGTWARTGLPPAEHTWTYDAGNRLTTRDQATLTYDDNGDLVHISDQGTTMTLIWNARHHLVGISGGGITASFVYDGVGRRIRKTVNSVTTDFLYDGLNPIQEWSGGSPVATLLTGLGIDEVISRTESGSTATFLTDALGSTVALTDGTGAVQTEYTYEPFGAVTVTGTSSTNSYQFTGREHDGTGLFYYRARYYSHLLQRFISEDPIGFAGGDPNLYAYAFNSPTKFTDPSGLSFTLEFYPVPGGYGGGFTLGQHGAGQWSDPWYVEAWAGNGAGGGWSMGGPDNPAFNDGLAISAEIKANGHVFTHGGEVSGELGGHFPESGSPSAFSKLDIDPSFELTNKFGFRGSIKIGARVGFYNLGGKGGSGGGSGGSGSGDGSSGGSGSSGGGGGRNEAGGRK